MFNKSSIYLPQIPNEIIFGIICRDGTGVQRKIGENERKIGIKCRKNSYKNETFFEGHFLNAENWGKQVPVEKLLMILFSVKVLKLLLCSYQYC